MKQSTTLWIQTSSQQVQEHFTDKLTWKFERARQEVAKRNGRRIYQFSLVSYNNIGKFQTLFQECLWVENLLYSYFVVHDLKLLILVIQVFVWNSIFVTLIQCQWWGNMTVIQVPSWASVAADPGRRDKGATNWKFHIKKKIYIFFALK